MIWNWLSHYSLFLAKTFTLAGAILCTLAGIMAIARKSKHEGRMRVRTLNESFQQKAEALLLHGSNKKALKQHRKRCKQWKKQPPSKRLFVLRFDGDIRARGVNALRDEITTILLNHQPDDQVAICIESGGGLVHAYGLAASQLARLRDAHIPLTALVDKVAASGGYLMASVANEIIAAPFAILGSIGVLAQMPNFYRWLQKNDIDFEQIMAGEYKRTLTMFGENTDKAREKFQDDINEVHQLFKQFVQRYRPQLDINQVATGELWYGQQALENKLIDRCQTSDDFLCAHLQDWQLIEISSHKPQAWLQQLTQKAMAYWQQIWHPASHTTKV